MKTITYRFEVKATSPLATTEHDPDYYTEAVATSPEHRRRFEKALYTLLRKFEMDCDVELMDFTIEDDGLHGGDCTCEQCAMERAADTADEVRHD